MSKPTYAAIADMARVGTATVERVLNGRGGVRPDTVVKVLTAARSLDWPGRLPERHRGIIRIEVILVRPDTTFYSRLATAFKRIASSLDPSIQIHLTFLAEDEPETIAARIANPGAHRSGLVICSPSHPLIAEALRKLHVEGLPIVQTVSRTIDEATYVGIDNYAVGRTAGMMLSRLGAVKGTVVALCHSQIYQVHRDRIRGFSDYIAQNPLAGLRFESVLFGLDQREESVQSLIEALKTWPDLAGFYNSGGGNTGLMRYMEKIRGDIFFVGHELTPVTQAAIQNGTADVIFDQMPEAQARRSIDLLFWKIGLLDERVDNPPIRFTTITAENL